MPPVDVVAAQQADASAIAMPPVDVVAAQQADASASITQQVQVAGESCVACTFLLLAYQLAIKRCVVVQRSGP